MAFDLQTVLIAARDTVQNPKEGARALLSLRLPANVAWVGLVLMAVVSSALSTVTFLMSGASGDSSLDPAMVALFTNPIQLAAMQAGLLLIGALLIHGVGRMFGGTGQINEALLLVAWLEFILLLLQIAQTMILLISEPMAAALGLFGLVLFLWLLSNFIAELHGFSSVLAVFFGIIGAVLALSFAAAVLIVALVGVGV